MSIIFKSRRPIYKQGKLSRRRRTFSLAKMKTPIIIISCVLATFVVSIMFGNILGCMAENSKNTTVTGEKGNGPASPVIDLGSGAPSIKAYSVDMAGADPMQSLKNQTGDARERGSALFMLVKNSAGNIVYTSDMTEELGYSSYDNLTLERLNSHFTASPPDYVCAYWKSAFGENMSADALVEEQNREVKLLRELSKNGVSEILVSFSGRVDEDYLIKYQTYLLNLQMGVPGTYIGIEIDADMLAAENSAYMISELMKVCDFLAVDFEGAYETNEELSEKLLSCIYLSQKYSTRFMISYKNEEFFTETLSVLEKLKIDNYIVSSFHKQK